MPRATALVLAAAFTLSASALPARAGDATSFMQRFSGDWIGTGQLLFGAEPRPEFACELNGSTDGGKETFGLNGQCRMGAFSAPVYAEIRYNTDTNRYYGQFMGGSAGDGVDLVGARAGEGFSLNLVRGSMQGRLSAETVGSGQMKVVIYYRDVRTNSESPVVAMDLTRREIITGSITPRN